MTQNYRPPFDTILPATFDARPNRFLVRCRLADGELVNAFLPNPGRLQELLFPGVTVYIVPAVQSEKRKTPFTMIGVDGDAHPVFLHTHVNNDVARYLLERGLVQGLEGARILRAEVPLGHSRFDFLLERGGEPLFLEVKSCTLFGNKVAMFPDAVTARGRRHLEELAALSSAGTRAAVLFVVHSGQVDWFMPDYHTDPDFSRTLLQVRDALEIIPLSISWNDDFRLGARIRRLPIPWDHIEGELGDRGNFLLLCREARLGSSDAFHIFAGWCNSGLFKFIRGSAKRPPEAGLIVVEHFALVSSVDHEQEIIASLRESYPMRDSDRTGAISAVHFAASSPTDPRLDRKFHQLLAKFRMIQPKSPELGRQSPSAVSCFPV